MYSTRFSSNYFKSFCLSLVVSFVAQQAAFAAPALDVSGLIGSPSEIHSLHIPESIALIDDAYTAGPGAATVYLLQDAHTNASGQFNMAKTIDFLIAKKNTDLVFTEAADGEISLSDLKAQTSPDVMKFEATALVRKGYLHASEFLALTGSRDFRLIGVEDRALYDEGLLIYRQIMSERPAALAYLKKLNRTAKVLKAQIYSADLMRLDELKSDYLKNKLSVTDYVIGLSGLAGADSIRFKSITELSKLKQMEDAIDFEEASRSQNDLLMRLPEEDQDVLHDMLKSSARKVGLKEDKAHTGFYALLKEKAAAILNEYPEFEKYLRYVNESKKLNIPQVLEELEQYESAVAEQLIVTPDQRALLTLSENLRLLESLWNMQIDPAAFSRYQQKKTSYSTKVISGFFNKKIMDLEGYFEHAAELDESFDRSTEKIERFYNLTYQRDAAFIRRLMQNVHADSGKSSILIAGGYHTPNLKSLLKENGYSYVSITPQVIHETNYMRYESLLLSQIRDTDAESGTLSSDADKWMTLDISAPSTNVSSPVFSRAQLNDLLISGRTQPQATPAVAASRLALFGDKGVQSDSDKAELLARIRGGHISHRELEEMRGCLTDPTSLTYDETVKRFRQPVTEDRTFGNMLGITSHEKQIELSRKVTANQQEVLEAIDTEWKVLRSNADKKILLKRIFESPITFNGLIALRAALTDTAVETEDEVIKRFREFELTDAHTVNRGEVLSQLDELLSGVGEKLHVLLEDEYNFFEDTKFSEAVLEYVESIKTHLLSIADYEASIHKLVDGIEIPDWTDRMRRRYQELTSNISKKQSLIQKSLAAISELLPDKDYQALFYIDHKTRSSDVWPFSVALTHLTSLRKKGTPKDQIVEDVNAKSGAAVVGADSRGETYRLENMIFDAETAFIAYLENGFNTDEAVEKYHHALSQNIRWSQGAKKGGSLQYSHEIERGFLFTDINWMIKVFDPENLLDESARAALRVKYAEAQKRVRLLFNEKLLAPLTAKYKDFLDIAEIDRLGEVLYPLVSEEGALRSLSNEKIEWFIRDLKANAGHGRDIPEPEYENDQISNSLQIESALRHLYFELHVLRELRIYTSGIVPADNPWSQRGIRGARLTSETNDAADDLFAVVAGNVVEGYLPQNAEERRLLRLFAAKVKNNSRYAVLWDSGHLSVVDVADRDGTVEIRIQDQLVETVELNRINREYSLAGSEEKLAADRVADALLAAEEIKTAITEGSESVQILTENRRNNFSYGFSIPVSRLFDFDSIRDAQERESASQFLLSIMKWAAGSDWGGIGRVVFHISETELNALPEDQKKFWSRAIEAYPFITAAPIDTSSGEYVSVAWITDESESVENAVNIKMPKLRRGEMPLNFSNGVTMAIEVFLTVVPDSKETAGEAKRYFSRATSGLGELLTDINHKLTAPFKNETAALEAFQQGRYGIRQTLKTGLVKVGEYLRSLRLVRATVRISA